jgi:hypothetical protein
MVPHAEWFVRAMEDARANRKRDWGILTFLAALTAAVVVYPLVVCLWRRSFLFLFYYGIVGCWTLGNISESAHSADFPPALAISLAVSTVILNIWSPCGN